MVKKICFFTSHFDYSRQKLVEYYEQVLPKDVEIFLFCLEATKDQFKFERVKLVGYTNKFMLPFQLRRFLKRNQIDEIINVSGSSSVSSILLFSTLLSDTDYISYQHGNFFWGRKEIDSIPFLAYTISNNAKHWFFFISQFFMKRILLCAKDLTEKIKRYFFLNKNKIFYLPSAVDIDFFRPVNKKSARKKIGLNQKDKVVIYVGRVSYLKGSDFLFPLIKRNPDKKFIIIGNMMDKNFKKQKFPNIIHVPKIPPTSKKILDYYSAADLCVIFSRTEGNAYVPREAMACETPAMVMDIDSLRLLSPPAIKVSRNINIIQKKLERFFNLPEKQKKKIGKESRKFIVKEFSGRELEKKYLKCFSVEE